MGTDVPVWMRVKWERNVFGEQLLQLGADICPFVQNRIHEKAAYSYENQK